MKPGVVVFFVFTVSSMLLLSCHEEKDATPKVPTEFLTKAAEDVLVTEAVIKGELSIGTEPISDCGFVWGIVPNPSLGSDKKSFGAKNSNEQLSHKLTGLQSKTTYYYKTFYTSGSTTVYGEELSFTTGRHAEFTTKVAEEVSFTEALVKGELSIGAEAISDCGFVWGIVPNPSLASDKKGLGAKVSDEKLSHKLTGLQSNTKYYYKTFYTSGSTTVYGEELFFTTKRHSAFATAEAEDISFTEVSLSGELLIFDDEIFECGFVWSKAPNPTTATGEKKYFGPQAQAKALTFTLAGLSINSTYYFRTFFITSSGVVYGDEFSFTTLAEVVWSEPGGFPGDERMAAISLSIGSKAYVGLGHGRDTENHIVWFKDFWEFDMVNNTWTKRKDYPGMGSSGAVAFTIQGKGYVGTGSGASGTGKDFWEYDPAADSWTQKADLVGSPVSYATGFALNGKGYIGTGVEFGNGDFLKTFYEYDPALDKWTRKADFPGFAVDQAVGFSIGDLGYIGMGLRMESWLGHTKQLWAYSPATNTWTPKKDCPSAQSLDGSVAFVMNDKAYVGLGWGYGTTIWQYDPELNDWQENGSVVKSRISAIAIPLGNKVIIGTGASTSSYYKDFEDYVPQ